MSRLLMIDDDTKLLDLMKEYLAGFGFDLVGVSTPSEGLRRFVASPSDLVILDVTLPEMDGFEVCRRLRALGDVPILMLSARGEPVDRIVGLELGADDYLPKPFDPRELVSRIQAILRRPRVPVQRPDLSFGPLIVSVSRREVFRDGRALGFSSMEFDLVALLCQSPGRKFHRDEILSVLQGSSPEIQSRSVDILVSRVRAKLGDNPKTPQFILSIRGWGYLFQGDRV